MFHKIQFLSFCSDFPCKPQVLYKMGQIYFCLCDIFLNLSFFSVNFMCLIFQGEMCFGQSEHSFGVTGHGRPRETAALRPQPSRSVKGSLRLGDKYCRRYPESGLEYHWYHETGSIFRLLQCDYHINLTIAKNNYILTDYVQN